MAGDEQRQRQETYRNAAKEFARVLVVVSTPLGVAAILIGAYLSFLAVGTGLILGGIFTVAWGYWNCRPAAGSGVQPPGWR